MKNGIKIFLLQLAFVCFALAMYTSKKFPKEGEPLLLSLIMLVFISMLLLFKDRF